MQGREYDPALTVSNTGPDKSQPEPLWHVKRRTDAKGLHFFEVGTKDGSHYITVSGNQRWMSRDEDSARRVAAKANLVLVEAVLAAGEIDPEPEWRIEAGAEAQAAAEAAGFATVEEWHNAPGWHDVSEHQSEIES